MPVADPNIEAEALTISSGCMLIVASSSLFQLHEERLVLRRPRVRIARRWGKEIRERAFVSLLRRIPPMNRESDLGDVFPVDLERRQSSRHHRRAFDRSACRSY